MGLTCVVVGAYPTPDDAPALDVGRRLADRLGGAYHLVVPCGPAPPGSVDRHPVHLHRVRARNRLGYLAGARRTVDRIAGSGPHVLMSSNPLAAMVVESCRARRAHPHVFHVQGEVLRPGPEYGPLPKRLALGAATRLGLRRATGVRVVSMNLGRAVAPFAAGPVAVLGSRVDTGMFRPGPPGPYPVAVMVGGLVPVKNHLTVVHAWPSVVARCPGARLVVVGDGPCRRRIEEAVDRLGLAGHVTLAGRLPHRDLPALLASARCLVQPSWSEGQPRSVLEGMSCGLPVVCSDIPAHREIVPPGAGRLVPPADVASWADAVAHVLGDPAGGAAMGRCGRAVVLRDHEQETSLDRYAAFVTSVAARSRTP